MPKCTLLFLIPFKECEALLMSAVVLACGFFPTARISGVTIFSSMPGSFQEAYWDGHGAAKFCFQVSD